MAGGVSITDWPAHVATFDNLLDAETNLWSRITDGTASLDEFKSGFESWESNKDAIKQLLAGKKKDELQEVIQALRAKDFEVDLQFTNGDGDVNFPRHFMLTPDGAFLVVSNQKGNSVTVFRVAAGDGTLAKVGRTFF